MKPIIISDYRRYCWNFTTINLKDIKTINGNIEITKCRGNTSLESSNGNINVYTHDGSIKAKTLNGVIKVDVHSIKETSEITSKNGAVYAYISRRLNLNIESSTLNGNIEIGI